MIEQQLRSASQALERGEPQQALLITEDHLGQHANAQISDQHFARSELIVAHALRMSDNVPAAIERACALAQRFPLQLAVQKQCGYLLMQLDAQHDAAATLLQATSLAHAQHKRDAALAYSAGCAAQQTGMLDQGLKAYALAVLWEPRFVEAWVNRGTTALALNDPAQAIQCAREAINVAPSFALAHNLLGICLMRANRWSDAVITLTRCADHDPSLLEGWQNLASAAEAAGDVDSMSKALTRVIAIAKQLSNDSAAHVRHAQLIEQSRFRLAAAQGVQNKSMPAHLVEHIFDEMAGTFDTHLQSRLKYQIPELLVGALQKTTVPNGIALDLGCGTGLFARRWIEAGRNELTFDGCDLSEKMVQLARATGYYRSVQQSDLLTLLAQYTATPVAAIVATDVFVYVGELAAVFQTSSRVLMLNGVFTFSIELTDDSHSVLLQTSGRYAHSKRYIADLAEQHGFALELKFDTPIREERGKPIPGCALMLRKFNEASTA